MRKRDIFIIFGAVLAVRGFFTAFAITASMRIYGICGLFLNAGSIISSLLVVPGIVCYGKFLYMGCCEKKGFKFLIVSLLFLSLILFLDCVMKGVVSPYIVKWWK